MRAPEGVSERGVNGGRMEWQLALCGFAVGGLVGLTGMGGGSVMTALLIVVFGMHPVAAVGTDLLYAAVTKATGARVHARRGNVDWGIVGLMAAGSVPGVAATLWLLSRAKVHNPALVAHTVTLALGCLLILGGIGLLVRPRLEAVALREADGEAGTRTRPLVTVLLGLVLGPLVTLTSVGAGALGLVVLQFLYPRMAVVRLVGTDIAHAVPLTLLAGAGHWVLGDIDWRVLLALLAGSIPGIMLAAHVAHRVPERPLQVALGVMLIGIGVRTVLL